MKARSALPLLLSLTLVTSVAFAQPAAPAGQGYVDPTPVHPAVANTPPPQPRPPITERWWFWTAVAGVVVAGAVVAIVATREPSPPRTILGNMEAFRKP